MKFYPNYVIDASVIIAYLFKENKTILDNISLPLQKANNAEAKIYSTYLLPIEVGNSIKQKETSRLSGVKAFSQFFEFPIEYIDFDASFLKKCMELVYATNTSFYDASYHVLAIVHNATFLTLDKKYFEKAKQRGNIELFT